MVIGVPEHITRNANIGLRSEKIKHDKIIIHEICEMAGVEISEDDMMGIKKIEKYNGEPNKDDRNSNLKKGRPTEVTKREGLK